MSRNISENMQESVAENYWRANSNSIQIVHIFTGSGEFGQFMAQ